VKSLRAGEIPEGVGEGSERILEIFFSPLRINPGQGGFSRESGPDAAMFAAKLPPDNRRKTPVSVV
jgi:hypothetical protein